MCAVVYTFFPTLLLRSFAESYTSLYESIVLILFFTGESQEFVSLSKKRLFYDFLKLFLFKLQRVSYACSNNLQILPICSTTLFLFQNVQKPIKKESYSTENILDIAAYERRVLEVFLASTADK
jgi:hypothetical protein